MGKGYWLFLFALFVLVTWRVWGWQEQVSENWCDGCAFSQVMRVWQPPVVEERRAYIDYRGLRVNCYAGGGCLQLLSGLSGGERVAVDGNFDVNAETGWRQVVNPKVRVVSGPVGWLVAVHTLRERVVELYERVLPEPEAGLLAGIVLGEKRTMPEWFEEALIVTGTLHVVAASGFNITVVARVLMGSLVFVVSRRMALGLSLFGVVGYVLLAGGSPAVVRAGVMGVLLVMAQFLGRDYAARWILVWSAGLLLLLAPWLFGSVSFQLSVAATAGILWGEKRLREWLGQWVPDFGEGAGRLKAVVGDGFGVVQSDLATTLAATLATLPITLVTFERFSVVSPLVNALLLWLVPPIMGFGGLVAGVGLLVPFLGQLVAYVVYPLLWLFVIGVEWFGGLPGASVSVSGLGWWVGAGWWVVLLGWWGVNKL